MRRLLTTAVAGLILLPGSLLHGLMAGAAEGAPVPAPTSSTSCLRGADQPALGHAWRAGDPSALSAAQVRRLEQQTRRVTAQRPRLATRAAGDTGVRTVGVAVHVIQQQPGEVEVDRERARTMLRVLNGGFAGAQSRNAFASSFRFRMVRYDRTVNPRWYEADIAVRQSRPAVVRMKRSLRVGGPETLNLYLSRPQKLLGWATLPQEYRSAPRLDGVVINIGSLRGGDIRNYNGGDTVIHEVGHWMGLYHTFQGKCSRLNDHVSDTAPERGPNYECPRGLDTCTDDEQLDPIHNFMDYSYDRCLDRFTSGQDERMLLHWLAYRQ